MYTLKELSYLYQDLEPFVDTHTMGLHFQKHAKNYLKKLNDIFLKNHFNFSYSLEDLPKYIHEFPEENREEILFNAGGVLNHQLYFQSMHPKGELPQGNFLLRLQQTFGSYTSFLEELKKKALLVRGSGYTFLVVDKNKNIALINMPNQDTPYAYDLVPLLCIDMWEHAYYLNVQNNKDLYIDNFIKVIDFSLANKYFE